MASGLETREELETAIRDAETREREARQELEALNGQRAHLLERRIGGFRELARVRMQDALADGVIDDADQLSSEVASLLAAREKTIAALRHRQTTALEAREKHVAELDALTRDIAEREGRLDAIAEEARAELARDETFKSQSVAVASLESTHDRAKAKATKAMADRVEKGRPYENDPLFMYLWRRQYGRRDYKASGIVRWLDDKVAHFIRFHDARANYSVLIEIPDRLGAHADNVGEKLVMARAILDARVGEKISALAGEDIVTALKDLRVRKAAATRELTDIAAELSEIGVQINRYAEGQDDGLRLAMSKTTDFLAHESVERLREIARKTPAPTDDQLVARVVGIDRDLAGLDRKSEEMKKRLDELFARRQELIRIATEFRRANYDEPGNVFNEPGTGSDLLAEFLRGVITAADYWSRTQDQHRWRSRPADPFRRSSGLPPFDGSIFGGRRGSAGGGRRSGGGGFGGGDFKTGGGF